MSGKGGEGAAGVSWRVLEQGQLRLLLRARFLRDVEGLNKIQGQPFRTWEIERKIAAMLGDARHEGGRTGAPAAGDAAGGMSA